MKPFATLGSEIGKVRDRVRRGAEALRPTRVAHDVRDQRDRLLAKLGEQTFRLIAEKKLVVPKMLQDSVERLASLLGVQLPPLDGELRASTVPPPHAPVPASAVAHRASRPVDEAIGDDGDDEPSLGDSSEATPPPPAAAAPHAAHAQVPASRQAARAPAPAPSRGAASTAAGASPTGSRTPSQKRGAKRRGKR